MKLVSLLSRLLIYCALFSGAVVLAQTNENEESHSEPYIPFTIKRIGTKEGLPQNYVIDIQATNRGELIISTGNGLVLYNGSSFYPIQNSPNHLLYNRIIPVGDKIFGQKNQIIQQIHPEFNNYKYEKGDMFTLANNTLYKFCKDGNIYHSENLKDSFLLISSTGIKNVNHFFGNRRHLFFSSTSKTISFDLETKIVDSIFNRKLKFIEHHPNGKILCSDANTLYILGNNLKLELLNSFSLSSIILDVAFLDEERFWLITSNSLVFYNGTSYEIYKHGYGIPYAASIYHLPEEDCLFLGTPVDGFYQLKLKNTHTIGEVTGGYPSINNIIQAESGEIYVAGWDSHFCTLKDNALHPVLNDDLNESSSVNIINDTLLVGNVKNGVQRMSKGKIIDHILSQYGQCNASILDDNGIYWFGTNNHLLTGGNPKSAKPYHQEVFSGLVSSLYKKKNGTICVGQEGYFHLITKAGRITKYRVVIESFSPKMVRCFFEDSQGSLWIGTYGDGLFCLKENGHLVHVNSLRNCELSDDVFTLVLDELGNLVMTSNKGLFYVPLSKLQDFTNGKRDYLIPFILEEESGMLTSEFNGGMNINYCRLPNGHLLFPSIKGVIEYTPMAVPTRKLRPYILSVSQDDSIVSKSHIFSREAINIQFSVFAASYLSRYNLKYQYKLSSSNYNKVDWSECKSDGNISFSLLAPGNYVLYVRALDGMNDSNPNVLKYAFTIDSYFYEETWFQACVMILLGLILVAFLIIWSKRIKAKEQREQAIKNTISDFRLQAIQAKMNPHFIFNSLNGIYHLMTSKKHEEAEKLLLEFAKFLRKFIEQDSRNSNELQYEVEFLRGYLEVERKRIRGGFEIRTELPQSISKRLIPTSILMPFVENAVHHGIFHSPNKCYISIKVVEHKYGMKIFISDNGIGMNESKKINSERENHESKGIHFVKKKIELFENLYNIKIKLRIGNSDVGTLVSLFIPFYD